MAQARKTTKKADTSSRRRPAMSIEARQNQIAALAYDRVEERIRNGTASAQELVYFLKIGSIREQEELEMLELKKAETAAKTEAMRAAARSGEEYAEALAAFKSYKGTDDDDYD